MEQPNQQQSKTPPPTPPRAPRTPPKVPARRVTASLKRNSTGNKFPNHPPPMNPELLSDIKTPPQRRIPERPPRPLINRPQATLLPPKEILSTDSPRDLILPVDGQSPPTSTTNQPEQSSPRSEEKKKSTKEPKRKRILRRRTKSKGFSSLRKDEIPSESSSSFSNIKQRGKHAETEMIIQKKTEQQPQQPAAKKILLLRVRLQDDNYKTMTIEETTTAADFCEKLSNKLRKERPEQVWDGCELFETVDGEEVPVDGSIIISEHLDIQYLFKRPGEEVANPEEELKRIIQKRNHEQALRNSKLCRTCFNCQIEAFPNEDHEYLYLLFDILAELTQDSQGDVQSLPKNIPQQLEALEELVAQTKKRYQTVKKVKKRNQKLFVDTSNVLVIRKIAEAGGSYASIYSVLVDGLECAMKELILDGVTDESAFLTEIAVLDALPPHENLVHYLFHIRTEKQIRLFMSLYDESLQDFIKRRRESGRGPLSLGQLRKYLLQIASGLDYLHSYNIVHRDLKSGNIFIRLDTKGDIQNLVVADFDTAIQVESESTLLHQTMGTPGFMAPEVLKAKEEGYTISGDIFSFGMIIFELLYLDSPYSECENSYDISAKILQGEAPAEPFELSIEYLPFIHLYRACTSLKPLIRPSSSEVLTAIKQLPEAKEKFHHLTPRKLTKSTEKSLVDVTATYKNPLYNLSLDQNRM